MRKTAGADRRDLIGQFYFESALTILLSLAAAAVLFWLFYPVFSRLLDLQVQLSFLTTPLFLLSATAVVVLCILLAGSYPALVLSRFMPAEVIKGQAQGGSRSTLRQSLTVFQLMVSTGLIFCSIVIFSQVDKIRNRQLGLNKAQLLTLSLDPEASGKNGALMNEISAIPGIKGISGSVNRLFEMGFNMNGIRKEGDTDDKNNVATIILEADTAYANLLELEWVVQPQPISGDVSKKIILNEAAAKGLDSDYKNINRITGMDVPVEVAGICKNFHYLNPRNNVEPTMIRFVNNPQKFGYLAIKLQKDANSKVALDKIREAYLRYRVEAPFDYAFADEAFDKLFKSEDRIAGLFGLFTGVAIFIACIGLFGLASFMAERRTKEVGIRKVLGASVAGIVHLLTKDFLKLVLIATVIASPISWYFMSKWLTDFTYRIDIQWWMFVVSGVLAAAVALLTVGAQSVKTALADPVKALRNE